MNSVISPCNRFEDEKFELFIRFGDKGLHSFTQLAYRFCLSYFTGLVDRVDVRWMFCQHWVILITF